MTSKCNSKIHIYIYYIYIYIFWYITPHSSSTKIYLFRKRLLKSPSMLLTTFVTFPKSQKYFVYSGKDLFKEVKLSLALI